MLTPAEVAIIEATDEIIPAIACPDMAASVYSDDILPASFITALCTIVENIVIIADALKLSQKYKVTQVELSRTAVIATGINIATIPNRDV